MTPEDQLAELRQSAAVAQKTNRELRQEVRSIKDRNRTLHQEISRLQEVIKKKDREITEATSITLGYGMLKGALQGVIDQRYGKVKPKDHDCNWCERCVTRVWQKANEALARS